MNNGGTRISIPPVEARLTRNDQSPAPVEESLASSARINAWLCKQKEILRAAANSMLSLNRTKRLVPSTFLAYFRTPTRTLFSGISRYNNCNSHVLRQCEAGCHALRICNEMAELSGMRFCFSCLKFLLLKHKKVKKRPAKGTPNVNTTKKPTIGDGS